MTHRNARLTPVTQWELVEQVATGWTEAAVARQFRVSRATMAKWVRCFRREGRAGFEDRRSTPHRHPRQTAPALVQQIVSLRHPPRREHSCSFDKVMR